MSATLDANVDAPFDAERVDAERVDARLLEDVRAGLVAAGVAPTPAQVAHALREHGGVLGDAAVLEAAQRLHSELEGAGPLEHLLGRPGLSDVLVNGADEVWVDDGDGLARTGLRFPSDDAVRRLAVRLATAAGRRLDEASPFVDVLLPSGVRLHAALPPVAPDGPLLSIRVPPARTLTLAHLVATGWAPVELVPWVEAVVRSHVGFLVTGGTGAGKTTVLSTLLSLSDPGERILLVEDAGELRPEHPHVVRLQTRSPNVEGTGRVTLGDLVRQALRMRPDRIVLGEVRGAEVVDWLAAMNTGHTGCCGTLHANRPEDVPARLEALGVAAGLDRAAVHSQVAAALHVVLHVVRGSGGQRRLASVGVVETLAAGVAAGAGAGVVAVRPAITVREDGVLAEGPGLSTLTAALSGGAT